MEHEHAESFCNALETSQDCSNSTNSKRVLRAELVSEGVQQWSVAQVLSFFEQCKFPTAGVMTGQVDGMTLLSLFEGDDAEANFTAPAPEGMSFNRLLFRGRFKKEMVNLRAGHKTYPQKL